MNIKKILSEFISIRTDHPKPDYDAAIKFLTQLAFRMGFSCETIPLLDDKKAVLIKYYNNNDKSILLNCHMDVVQVNNKFWDSDPFTLTTKNDKNYGRGTQDMKSIGIMYLFALKKLKDENYKPKTNIIISFVPEEEVMGVKGMNLLVDKLPKIIFALDEGIPSENNDLVLHYGERKLFWIKLMADGETGHGSKYIKNNAIIKLMDALNHILEYAKEEKDKYFSFLDLSKVTTINLDYVKAGNETAYNVIPDYCEAGFDIRIPPHRDIKDIINIFNYCKREYGIDYKFIKGTDLNMYKNPITDINNLYVGILEETLNKIKIKYKFGIFPATTDARYLRNKKIPVIGISPMRNTKNLLHDHNEYIMDKSLEEGVGIYYNFIKNCNNF